MIPSHKTINGLVEFGKTIDETTLSDTFIVEFRDKNFHILEKNSDTVDEGTEEVKVSYSTLFHRTIVTVDIQSYISGKFSYEGGAVPRNNVTTEAIANNIVFEEAFPDNVYYEVSVDEEAVKASTDKNCIGYVNTYSTVDNELITAIPFNFKVSDLSIIINEDGLNVLQNIVPNYEALIISYTEDYNVLIDDSEVDYKTEGDYPLTFYLVDADGNTVFELNETVTVRSLEKIQNSIAGLINQYREDNGLSKMDYYTELNSAGIKFLNCMVKQGYSSKESANAARLSQIQCTFTYYHSAILNVETWVDIITKSEYSDQIKSNSSIGAGVVYDENTQEYYYVFTFGI